MSVEQLAEKTSDAPNFSLYSDSGWRGAIRFLRKKGLNDLEIESFMRSKHTRWAGDGNSKRSCGHYNGKTIAEYISQCPSCIEKEELNLLVCGTFPELNNLKSA